jgi:hypothetical protein
MGHAFDARSTSEQLVRSSARAWTRVVVADPRCGCGSHETDVKLRPDRIDALGELALYAAVASRSVPREEPWRSIRFQHDVL